MKQVKLNLIEAEKKAAILFENISAKGLIVPGKSENELNSDIFNLAFDLFGINKYWHKRIVRAGKNTLKPYKENPQNLIIKEDDILFIDFGPIFDEWEADYGRTYVLGTDEYKHKLVEDISVAWNECKVFFESKDNITGSELFRYANEVAEKYGWEFGGEIAGHLIGHFPHEKLDNEDKTNYVHPENNVEMRALDKSGNKRDWILEIHFIDKEKEIGGFYEQLLT
ncbi:MAG: aminopeptidase [Flavobacteriaceae bacterium]|nr:aminopeptidase [Flavobacteriaceae bacterium]